MRRRSDVRHDSAEQDRGRDTEQYGAPADVTFADFSVSWLRDYAFVYVAPRTFESYETSIRTHLIPELGDLPLREITRLRVDSFVADWVVSGPRFAARRELARERERARADDLGRRPTYVSVGMSAKTIANVMLLLREMLGHAVEWGLLTANPCAGIRRPRDDRRSEERIKVLAPEEIRLLLDAAASPFTQTLLMTALMTGVRRGELLALTWADLDWQEARLWVRRSLSKDGTLRPPKTRKSIRAVVVVPSLVSALAALRTTSPFQAPTDYVFPSQRGTPLDGDGMVRRHLKPTLRRAGLPDMRFHDLRHCYASLLIAQGAHIRFIADQLGHTSVELLMTTYGHLLAHSYEDERCKLEETVFGSDSCAVWSG
jgi:integrase